MLKNISIFVLILFSLINNSCEKETISSEFAPYVNKFFEEAKKRNVKINTESHKLFFTYSELQDETSECRITSGKKNVVINRVVWEYLNELGREKLVFHELGHCLLGLSHINCTLQDGSSQSIMCGVQGICSGDVSYCFYNYGGIKRDYYVDFLFNDKTPAPWWSKVDEFKDPIATSQKNLIHNENFNDTLSLNFLKKSNIISQKETFNFENVSAFKLKKVTEEALNQDNIEIKTDFKFLNNDKANINFLWNPYLKDGTLNSYYIGFIKNKKSFQFVLFINFNASYSFDVSKFINSDNNTVRLRKVGNLCYIFLNNRLLYIQDIYPFNTKNIIEKGALIFSVDNMNIDNIDILKLNL